MKPATDHELLVRLHRGDAAAAQEFWARHAARVRAFARALMRSDPDADDAVQRVFCGLLSLEAPRVRAVQDVPAFLMRSVRNAALNRLRAARRERKRLAGRAFQSASFAGASPVDPDLGAALTALPRRQREVIVLRSVLGLTFDQAALALGINRSTAASRHAVGIAALTRLLAKDRSPTSERAVGVGGGIHD